MYTMTTTLRDNRSITWVALMLSLPTVYFIGASILKFELGIDAPFDAASPLLQQWHIGRTVGWKLFILMGPFMAFLLSIFQLLVVRMQFTRNHFLFQIILKKRWLPLFVASLSASLLGLLFSYLVVDSCF
jgi:hypothetical protein